MAPVESHYSVLNVRSCASFEEVKKAYRAQCRLCHPDKLSHLSEAERRAAEGKMRALNAAYEVLSSPRQRKSYDLTFADPEPTAPTTRATSSSCGPSLRPERPAGAGMAAPGVRMKGSEKPRYMTSSKYTQRAREARRMNSEERSQEPETPDFNLPPRYPSFSAQAEKPYAVPRSEFRVNPPMPPPPPMKDPQKPPPPPSVRAAASQAPKVYARRSDPSLYTVHVDGRSESCAQAEAAFQSTAGAAGFQPPPGPPKNPTWLQRQLDVAKQWEEMNAPPEEPTQQYQWKKASNSWMELKQQRKEREAQRKAEADEPFFDDAPRLATGSPRPE